MYSMKKIIAICAMSAALTAGFADTVGMAATPCQAQAICGVQAAQAVPSAEVLPFTAAKAALNETSIVLIKGQTFQLQLTGTSRKATWSSSDEAVATVTASGKVKAKTKGSAVVRAKVGGKEYTCTVAVETPKLNKTSLSVEEGKTFQLKLSGTAQKVSWSSSDRTVARVSSTGKMRGVKAGECKITAKVGSKKYVCKVTVTGEETEDSKIENTCPDCGTSYKDTVVAPSKDGAGYTLHACSTCKTSYKDTYVDYNPTSQEVYEAITALRGQYPDKTPWTNENFYSWKGGLYSGGYGCAAFAFLMSDAAFGYLPARMHTDYSDIRVGDILRINNDTHSVIVLEVSGTEVTIAEGNYNNSVLWGRKLNRADLQGENNYIMTRYPEQGTEKDEK